MSKFIYFYTVLFLSVFYVVNLESLENNDIKSNDISKDENINRTHNPKNSLLIYNDDIPPKIINDGVKSNRFTKKWHKIIKYFDIKEDISAYAFINYQASFNGKRTDSKTNKDITRSGSNFYNGVSFDGEVTLNKLIIIPGQIGLNFQFNLNYSETYHYDPTTSLGYNNSNTYYQFDFAPFYQIGVKYFYFRLGYNYRAYIAETTSIASDNTYTDINYNNDPRNPIDYNTSMFFISFKGSYQRYGYIINFRQSAGGHSSNVQSSDIDVSANFNIIRNIYIDVGYVYSRYYNNSSNSTYDEYGVNRAYIGLGASI